MGSTFELLPALMRGTVVTLEISIFSPFFAFIISFLFGFGRLSRFALIRWLSTIFVEVIRGTSLLVQMFWIYFALPLIGINLPAMAAGILALSLNYGAYGAEVVRSSILAIPKSQTEATIALNMSRFHRMRLVILPQAFLVMLPAFGNLTVELIKGTALVSLITLSDLTFQGMSMRTTFPTTEIFTLLLIIYFLITYPCIIAIRWVERKLSAGRL